MTLLRWLFRAVTVATDGGQVRDEPNLNSQVAKQFERNKKEKWMKVKQRKWMFASGHHSEGSLEKRRFISEDRRTLETVCGLQIVGCGARLTTETLASDLVLSASAGRGG